MAGPSQQTFYFDDFLDRGVREFVPDLAWVGVVLFSACSLRYSLENLLDDFFVCFLLESQVRPPPSRRA